MFKSNKNLSICMMKCTSFYLLQYQIFCTSRTLYMEHTAVCTWSTLPCVHGAHCRVYMEHTAVCTWSTLPCVHGAHCCVYMEHTAVCTWSTLPCVHGSHCCVSIATLKSLIQLTATGTATTQREGIVVFS